MEESNLITLHNIINGREVINMSCFEYICKKCKSKFKIYNETTKKFPFITCDNCKGSEIKIINVKNKYDDFTLLLDKIVENLAEEYLTNEVYEIEENLNNSVEVSNILKSNRININRIELAQIYDQLSDYISNNESFIIRYKRLQEGFKNNCKRKGPEIILNALKNLFQYRRDLFAKFIKLGIMHFGIKDIEFILKPSEINEIISRDINDILQSDISSIPCRLNKTSNEINNFDMYFNKTNDKQSINKTCSIIKPNKQTNEGIRINDFFEDREVLEEENNSIIEQGESVFDNNNSIIDDINILKECNDDEFINEKINILNNEKELNLEQIRNSNNCDEYELIKRRLKLNHFKYIKEEMKKESNKKQTHEKILKYLRNNKELFSDDEYKSLVEAENRHFKVNLRIYEYKYQIVKCITNNIITIIVADTGSGKSTQLIQYCELIKIADVDQKLYPIICTQPRKVSTMKIAKRVAEETNSKYEEDIYPLYNCAKLKDFKKIKKNSRFIFINETLLLFLLIEDPLLSDIYILILDEAHERTVNLDIILFLLRNYTLRKRKDLKLIITSATLEPTLIMNYLSIYKPNVINFVTPNNNISYVYYNQPSLLNNYLTHTIIVSDEVIENSLNTILKIKVNNLNGEKDDNDFISILVFLPDLKSILYVKNKLSSKFSSYIERGILKIFELNSTLEAKDQMKIIEYSKPLSVKVILSTKVAETSLTITNNNIVIDSGFHKICRYNYFTKMKEEVIELISRDAAIQRSGRTGRIKQGVCYRVYTEEQFLNMKEYRSPEIKLINFSHMLLKLLYFGIQDITRIQLIEQPSNSEIIIALNDLKRISAIREESKLERDSESYLEKSSNGLYEMTRFGKWLYDLQIDPLFGKIIYNTIKFYPKGLNIILKIISILTANDFLFLSFRTKQNICPFKEEEINNKDQMLKELENEYINELGMKIINEVIVSNEENELIRIQHDSLLTKQKEKLLDLEKNFIETSNQINLYNFYNKIFGILDPYFNKESYFVNNKILSLGDLTGNIFYYRQIDLISCQKHFQELDKENPNIYDCTHCRIIVYYYLFFYGYNSKNYLICENNYFNLKTLLSKHHKFINDDYFDSEVIKTERQLAYWTKIYLYLFRKDYQFLIDYEIDNVSKIENVKFSELFEILYVAYKKCYINLIGPIFLRMYQDNLGIKPTLQVYGNIEESEKEYIQKETYTLLDGKTKARPHQSSNYLKYIRKVVSSDNKIFYITSMDNNENIYLKNVNPLIKELYPYLKREIKEDVYYIKRQNVYNLFCYPNIGEYIFKILIERKKYLKMNPFQRITFSDEEAEILSNMQVNLTSNGNSIIFFSQKPVEIQKNIIDEIINKELYIIRENMIDEIGTLKNDCMIIKLKQGLNILNIDHNKDHIHYEIVFLVKEFPLIDLETLLEEYNMKYNKLFQTKNKCYISFRNNIQTNEFLKNLQKNTNMSKLIFLKLPNYNIRHNNLSGNNIILSIIGPNISNKLIYNKIEYYGKISDIYIRQITTENKSIQFAMEKVSEANIILSNFVDHEDEYGHWSCCKRIDSTITLGVNYFLLQNDPDFLNELSLYAEANKIQINLISKNRFQIENSTEERLSQILFFINDDIIQLNDFAIFEIKSRFRHTFMKGLDMKLFGQENKVLIIISFYFKKVHVYGTPEKRRKVKEMINNYMDEINTSVVRMDLEIPRFCALRKIYEFIDTIKKEYNDKEIGLIINLNKNLRVIEVIIRQNHYDLFKSRFEKNFPSDDFNDNKNISPNRRNTECKICLGDMKNTNIFSLSLCGDKYCKDCLKSYVSFQVNALPVIDMPIRCLCTEIILNCDIINIFSKTEMEHILYQVSKTFMSHQEKNKIFNWCENPDCSFIYNKRQYKDYNTTTRNCPNCFKTYCILCSNEIINNTHNSECKELILNKYPEADRIWLKNNTMNCVKCNFVYEKSEGCNHMVCKKCKPEVHFCFLCGRVIDKDNWEKHYNDIQSNPICYQKLYYNREIKKENYKEEEEKNSKVIEEEVKIKEEKKEESRSKDSDSKQNLRGDLVEIDLNLLMHNYENKDIYINNKSYFEKQYDNKNEVKKKKKERNINIFNKEDIVKTFKDIDESSDDDKFDIYVSSPDDDPEIKKVITNSKATNKKRKMEKEKGKVKVKELEKNEYKDDDFEDEENFLKEYSALIKKKELERRSMGNTEKQGINKKNDDFY